MFQVNTLKGRDADAMGDLEVAIEKQVEGEVVTGPFKVELNDVVVEVDIL